MHGCTLTLLWWGCWGWAVVALSHCLAEVGRHVWLYQTPALQHLGHINSHGILLLSSWGQRVPAVMTFFWCLVEAGRCALSPVLSSFIAKASACTQPRCSPTALLKLAGMPCLLHTPVTSLQRESVHNPHRGCPLITWSWCSRGLAFLGFTGL